MSDLAHVSFVAAIRNIATELGRTPTAEQIDNLDTSLKSLAQIDHEGRPVVGIEPVGAYIAREAGAFARATAPTPKSDAPVPASLRSTLDRIQDDAHAGILRIGAGVQHGRPPGDGFADIARGLQAQHAAAIAREAAGWLNPWRKGHENRTRQTVLSKIDPAKAAQFRAEAGV